MSKRFIPVDEVFAEWRIDPECIAAYDALEEEFSVADALNRARGEAGMTQEQVTAAMGTTQAAIGRLGCSLPPTRSLKRIADATSTKLRISFEAVTRSPR